MCFKHARGITGIGFGAWNPPDFVRHTIGQASHGRVCLRTICLENRYPSPLLYGAKDLHPHGGFDDRSGDSAVFYTELIFTHLVCSHHACQAITLGLAIHGRFTP